MTSLYETRVMQKHAVVIGAGMSGLSAARVLERFFEKITVLDRDDLPAGPAARAGVPQARHVHALVTRGAQELDGLFPGFLAELVEKGGHGLDVPHDGAILRPSGWQQPMRSGCTVYFATRDLTESIVRRRLREGGRVEILPRTEAAGLYVHPDAPGRVAGVHAVQRGGGANLTLAADLVIDASGRSSKAPSWLASLGAEVPREEVVDCHSGYSSRWYEAPEALPPDVWWKMVWLDPSPAEDHFIGGVLFPVEERRWIITLIGYAKHYPPSDEEGFFRTLGALRSPILQRMAELGRPISPIYSSRANQNRLRRFDKLANPLPGFVALSDSVCTFNPMYGQGMTVAALSARVLESTLERVSLGDPGFERVFFGNLHRAIKDAWNLATSADMRFPGAKSDLPRPSKFASFFGDSILRTMTHDAEVLRRVSPVYYMLKPTRSLFEPELAARVLLGGAAGLAAARFHPRPVPPNPPPRPES
ncbi:FAD-dependent oxidoreductase [Polyangium sp. 6x1]|uniref:FAD-dependent oxidoreductase n=1 Tax=Polyangium sp. 6x1 TaxID=3042689 RepID=UPI002482914C|nr:FAD-dependent oxidoreductase [Polyangium sp. 6x1]MDI1450853.1 NAD(P)-binding protein [Polyangium sp. 6x1]